jgi:hypothetical protein
MEDDTVLREATARRDASLAEARRLDDFIRLYNDLRGGRSAPAAASEPAGKGDSLGGDFILEKQRR